ncbi:hypothetical protein GLAREA_08704 [Glarea lozoyensis ATCC 20868]|uniref:Uncharacterized protein n=1 Tax=Glarea lozoyensis (strain ATCC 20868 / MF5171) TaxID=1116229 RepID=S3DX49_GLAL2|nr:uncharacterized protein GLAREA_08704 [Glarea lozoyensis ATCC 20868]EPE36541.1 hypothetical protein GLAREA_08704 [Glarea lozoyensis ATCC 20868]
MSACSSPARYIPPHKRGRSQSSTPSESRNSSNESNKSHILRKLANPEYVWPSLTRDNWAVGVVAFLPWEENRTAPIRCTRCKKKDGTPDKHALEKNAQEHPVIILRKSPPEIEDKDLMLEVVFTSSNPQPYRDDAGHIIDKSRSFPIRGTNQDRQIDSDKYEVENTLDICATRKKRSYVLSNHVYRAPFSELQCWYNSEDRLTKDAYKLLMSLVGIIPTEKWEDFTPAKKPAERVKEQNWNSMKTTSQVVVTAVSIKA